MTDQPPKPPPQPLTSPPSQPLTQPFTPPIPNYSLSTVCPGCAYPTIRRACKVRCERCGFMWDCSEL